MCDIFAGFFSITLVYLCKYTAPVVESDRYDRISERQCICDNIQWYGEFNSSPVIKQNMLLIAGRYPGFQTKSDPPARDVTVSPTGDRRGGAARGEVSEPPQ